MTATLDIIIPNWNSGVQLRTCLDSMAAVDQHAVDVRRIVVVDNASSDRSADSFEGLRVPVACIRNTTNRGFAAACNQGARGSDAQHLLFLNPDVRLFTDSLATPLAFLQAAGHERTGIVGIQLVNDCGEVSVTCARFPTVGRFLATMLALDRLFPRWFPGLFMWEWDHGATRQVDQVIGAFFLVRRSLFELLGGFDERFFVYFEEVDFSLRARQAGWHTVYVADARASHRGGGTSDQIKAARLFYNLRSRILYAYKHFGRTAATVLALATLGLEFVTRFMRGAAHGSATELLDTARAYTMLWRSLPSITNAARRARHPVHS
jgi:N-acetylglucosaminyl-diphospho-decaprenol L-rhamnosyltransferase